MRPDVRLGILLLGVFWCLVILALTVTASGSFFWPPATFGELIADAFTIVALVLVLAMLRFLIGVLRHPPE